MRSASHIVPVILAAGDSTRMGYPKALLPLGTDTFLTRILKTAARTGLSEPVIVLGRAAEAIRPAIAEWPATIRINPDPDRGQLSSIRLALSSIDPDAQAGMIWPVDQPAVSEELVSRLIRGFEKSDALIVFPRYGSRRGHPAIFHRALFQDFIDTPLEEGPKKIIPRYQQETLEVPTGESGVVEDVDTPEDYEALTGETLAAALSRRL